MAKGTITGTTSNSYIECKIEWSSTADNANNKSTITAALYYRRWNEYTTSGTGWFSLSIDGKQVAYVGDHYLVINKDWTKVAEGTYTVTHGSDGSKSVEINGYGAIPGTTLTSTTCGGTATLDTIYQTTIITSFTYGSAVNTSYLDQGGGYYYKSRNASYYTRAIISASGKNKTNQSLTVRTIDHGQKKAGSYRQSIIFTDEEKAAIYAKITADTEIKITVKLTTYSNSTYTLPVGTTSSSSAYTTIPENIKPAPALTISPINTHSFLKDKTVYVAGYSGVAITLSGTAGTGASITSYAISAGGQSSNTNTLTINKISQHGAFAVTGTLTDTRQRSTTIDETITVESYTSPRLHSLTATRGTYNTSNHSWVANDNGPDVQVSFKTALGLAAYGNRYQASFVVDGVVTRPNYGAVTNLAHDTEYKFHYIAMSSEGSHTLTVSVGDSMGETGSAEIIIPTTYITMEFRSTGKGIAFGKTSEKDAFECALDAEFDGNVDIGGNITKNGAPFLSLSDITTNAICASMSVNEANVIQIGGLPVLLQLKLTFSAQVAKYTGLFSGTGLISNLPANRNVKDSTNTYELELRSTMIQTLSVIPAGTYTFYCTCIPL